MLTGKVLQYNSTVHAEYYPSNLPTRSIFCEKDGAKVLGLFWATPRSSNGGLSVTDFKYTNAGGATPKPTTDSILTMLIQEEKGLSPYYYVVVPDNYTISTFTAACCDGCAAIADVTIPEPIFNPAICVPDFPTECPPCENTIFVHVPALEEGFDDYTATATCTDEDGNVVAMSPETVTAATPTLLAAAAQTAWASELGGGTFTLVGENIVVKTEVCKNFTLVIVQNEEE